MQPTQASASNSSTRIMVLRRDTKSTANALPKVVSVSNADMQSQTTTANSVSYQEQAVASTSQGAISLRSIEEGSTADQKRAKESCQLELLLKYMFELSVLPYDERKIRANDCPAKYYHLDMLFFALDAHMSWIRSKTLIAKLIISEREQNVRAIQMEKTWFWKNLADLAKSVVEHQKAQSKMLLHRDYGMHENTLIHAMEENYSEKKEIVRKTKRQLCEARRIHTDAIRRYQVEDQEILERLPELLSENKSILIFHKIFHFLTENDIKEIVKSAVAPTLMSAMPKTKNQFKCVRNPVTQLFWDSFLPKLSRDVFQKKFLQFICSSWKSDLDVIRKVAGDLKAARNDTQSCRIVAQSYFREALCTSAVNVIHYILQQSRIYSNLKSSGSNRRKFSRNKNEQRTTFQNLHKAYTEAYEKIYLPYVESQSKNWARLRHASPSQILIELKKDIEAVKKSRNNYRKNRDASAIPDHIQLINQVLEKLGKNGSITFRHINKLIAEEIDQTLVPPVATPSNLGGKKQSDSSRIKQSSTSHKKSTKKGGTTQTSTTVPVKKMIATGLTFQKHSLNMPEPADDVDENRNKTISQPKIIFKLQPQHQASASHQALANVISSPQSVEKEVGANLILEQDNLNKESLNWLYDEVGTEVDLIFQDDDFFGVYDQFHVAGDSVLPSTSHQELVCSPMFQIDESFTVPDNLFEGDDDIDAETGGNE